MIYVMVIMNKNDVLRSRLKIVILYGKIKAAYLHIL